MIVHQMTEREIMKEVYADLENVFRYEAVHQNKFRRLVIKSKRFPVYAHYIFRSPKKNKWIILLEALNKKEFGSKTRSKYLIIHNTPTGVYAIRVIWKGDRMRLQFYPPHFFSRYKERMVLEESGDRLIIRYFRYNSLFNVKHERRIVDRTTHEETLVGSAKDGVVFGTVTTEYNIIFKTFVPYEMLRDDQLEKYIKREKQRKEIRGESDEG